ncbi:MAG: membrane protein insertase YidC [Nitrospirota bacterium]|nr:membrane protein insertase YidC [Nitrospirota bacterium]
MQRNTILFIVLSMVILLGYPKLLKMFGIDMYSQPTATRPAPETAADKAPETTTPAAGHTTPATISPAATHAAPTPAAPGLKARTIEVETDLYHATLTTQGGVITGWQLKQYFDDDHTTPVELFTPPTVGAIYPLTVSIEGQTGADVGVWTADREAVRLTGAAADTLTLTWADPVSGAAFTKRLTFHADSYAVDLAVEPHNIPADYSVSLGSNFGIRKWNIGNIGFVGVANLVDGDVHREKAKDMESTPQVRKGKTEWTVSEDKYFIAALLPGNEPRAVVSRALAKEHVTTGVVMAADQPSTHTLYVGPKDYGQLRSFKLNLQENIDFGWFMFGSLALVRVLAEPIFLALKWINGMVGNWGISIVLLTLLIKTLFVPLTHKSYKSMRAMAAIAPLVKKLQEKYKDNRKRLGEETMALYREHNINPLGGCLPIFIQIPFFIAFFNILYTTIELRHAPFMLWIADLSAKDPYYVLPVVMGISMFVQQKIQPSTLDPAQARILQFLPILFTFFFMAFPAGLVLYWLFNNLFTITQQVVTRRYLEKTPEAAVASGGQKKKR